MADTPAILNTFALSHFCENARWALDYKGVSYAEVSWAPMLHMLRTWRLKKTYTPVLSIDGRVIQESAEICAYLEERFPEPVLIPAQHREEVLRVADEARSLGPHVRRLTYLAIGEDLELLQKAWALNVSPAEARLHKAVFPVSRRMAFKALQVNPEAGAASEKIVRNFLKEQDSSFRDPTRFLVGDTFTLADLTMASMLSPLARPAEHPFYPRMAYGKAGNAWVEKMQGYRMIDWVRGCYARHRARWAHRVEAARERHGRSQLVTGYHGAQLERMGDGKEPDAQLSPFRATTHYLGAQMAGFVRLKRRPALLKQLLAET